MHKCSFCNYSSDRKFCINRHEISKHSKEILNNVKNDNSIGKVNDLEEKVNVSEEKVNNDKNICYKCNKIYKTIKYLKNHEEKCKGIDILTCPKCMKYFPSKQSKSQHIKRDTCHARSIIHARIPNIQNITNNNNNISNITNIMTNSNNNNKTINYNNININNYGHERIDYFIVNDIYKFLISGDNTIPLFIEYKHFNKDFPENHNIIYDEKTKKCKIKENDEWISYDVNLLCNRLSYDNSDYLLSYINKNKKTLDNKIKNEEVSNHIYNKLLEIKLKINKEKFKDVFDRIKNKIQNYDNELLKTYILYKNILIS